MNLVSEIWRKSVRRAKYWTKSFTNSRFVGIVASIIGVAGAGFRLSLILNAIGCELANAPIEIQRIAKTVTLFSLMLKQTGTVLQTTDSVHSHEAVEVAKQISDESTRVFDEINDMLDRVRNKKSDGSVTPSIQQRFKWCFKKDRIYYLLGQLESLKLSLSLMLQILQLGKLMAATSKHDLPEEVKIKSAAIQQERVETQNIVIIRHFQLNEVDRLFRICEKDEPQDQKLDQKLTVEPPPEYSSTTTLIKLPLHSLGEMDEKLKQLETSSKDMIRISNEVIDPLLEKWTRWYEVREERHANRTTHKFVPSVQNLHEDDEDLPFHVKYSEQATQPGYYLEGSTTDWRQPNSSAARREASVLRKKYAGYQPSVSAASSDVEDSPGSHNSEKRRTKRHVINSSSDSESEDNKPSTRKSSNSSMTNKPTTKLQEAPHIDRLHPDSQPRQLRIPSSPTEAQTPKSNRSSVSPKYQPYPTNNSQPYLTNNSQPHPPIHPQAHPPMISQTYSPTVLQPLQYRPYPVPDQNIYHHSISSPLPPIYTHNAINPYATSPQNQPYHYNQRDHQREQYYSQPQSPRQSGYGGYGYPPRTPISRQTSREGSREGSGQVSREGSGNGRKSPGIRYSHEQDRPSSSYSSRPRSKEEKRSSLKALRDGATKGLLGAGAIGLFLEGLENLAL